jgi:hypothetical protein
VWNICTCEWCILNNPVPSISRVGSWKIKINHFVLPVELNPAANAITVFPSYTQIHFRPTHVILFADLWSTPPWRPSQVTPSARTVPVCRKCNWNKCYFSKAHCRYKLSRPFASRAVICKKVNDSMTSNIGRFWPPFWLLNCVIREQNYIELYCLISNSEFD